MERYLFKVSRREDGGWTASCDAFNVTVDADMAEDAVRTCRRLCEEEGQRILLSGELLPKSLDGLEEAMGDEFGLICEFSLTEHFKEEFSRPMRRNISMPEWMGRQLRRYGVDSSRLFQDAAAARIREISEGLDGTRKVTDWRDLEDVCAPGVLDSYLSHAFAEFLKKKGGIGHGNQEKLY